MVTNHNGSDRQSSSQTKTHGALDRGFARRALGDDMMPASRVLKKRSYHKFRFAETAGQRCEYGSARDQRAIGYGQAGRNICKAATMEFDF